MYLADRLKLHQNNFTILLPVKAVRNSEIEKNVDQMSKTIITSVLKGNHKNKKQHLSKLL